MAKWKLAQPHYLNMVEPIEWEHQETDPVTQRVLRKRYVVPLYINKGEIVNQGEGGEFEFIGDPTPDMVPIDAEAEAISDKLKPSWQVSEYGTGTESVLDNLTKELSKAMAAGISVANVSVPGVSAEAFAEMQGQLKALTEQNAQLLAKLLEEPKGRRL